LRENNDIYVELQKERKRLDVVACRTNERRRKWLEFGPTRNKWISFSVNQKLCELEDQIETQF